MGSGTDEAAEGDGVAVGRRGRPYDHSRDAEILAITLDALAERDYEHVTMDEIASRAGRAKTTLYRRWPTKVDLVLAAIDVVGSPPEATELPDEGTLRADLLAVTDSDWLGGPDRRMTIFAGLTTAARSSPVLADAIRTRITEPYVAVYGALFQRAVERGEISTELGPTIPLLAQVVPAMSSHRLGTSGPSVGREFFASVVDEIVLPALGHRGERGIGTNPG